MMDETYPPYFTDEQLCDRWRCSQMTLWRLRARGRLRKPIKIGGSPRGKNLTPGEVVKQLEEGGGDATT